MAFISAKAPKEDRLLQVGSNKFELVDFRIFETAEGAESTSPPIYEGIYGINIAKVQEINVMSQLTRLPNTHECIEGVLERRDEAIPVINLPRFLGYHNNQPKREDNIIICEFNHIVVGFIVHQAMRIRRISWEQIVPPTQLSGTERGSITGMYKLEADKMLLILDFERIVAEINGDTAAISRYEEEKATNQWTLPSDESRTILVVDDSATARMQTEMHLTQAGYRVFTATDGQDALDMLESMYQRAQLEGRMIYDLIQVIISDVEMPRVDGFAFANKVKKDQRFELMPIVMNTSLSGRSNMTQSEGLADEYIVKFSPKELLLACENLIEKLKERLEKVKSCSKKGK